MKKEFQNWLLLILLSVTWGASFILMKKGMYTSDGEHIFSDRQVASLRMLMACLALLPLAVSRLHHFKDWRNVLYLAIVGLIGSFFPAFLFTFAETKVASGFAGMLNSCTPVFALVIGFLVFGNRLSSSQVFGVLIGITGIILLSVSGGDFSTDTSPVYVLAIILATFFYGISVNTIKFKLQHLKSRDITSLSFFIIGFPALISFFREGTIETIQVNPHASQGLIYIGILSVIGTAVAVVLYNILISNSTLLFASTVTFFIPVFAMLFGVLNGEKITLIQIAAVLLILTGIVIANYLPLILKKKKIIQP